MCALFSQGKICATFLIDSTWYDFLMIFEDVGIKNGTRRHIRFFHRFETSIFRTSVNTQLLRNFGTLDILPKLQNFKMRKR